MPWRPTGVRELIALRQAQGTVLGAQSTSKLRGRCGAGVVDGRSGGGDVVGVRLPGGDGLAAEDVGGDVDAAGAELVAPVGDHRALVEAGQLLELGPVAGDDERAHAGPEGGAVALDAGAPVHDELVGGEALAAEVPGADAGLGEAEGDDLGVAGGDAGGEDDVDADGDEPARVALDDDRGERSAVALEEVPAGEGVHEAHAVLERRQDLADVGDLVADPGGEGEAEARGDHDQEASAAAARPGSGRGKSQRRPARGVRLALTLDLYIVGGGPGVTGFRWFSDARCSGAGLEARIWRSSVGKPAGRAFITGWRHDESQPLPARGFR